MPQPIFYRMINEKSRLGDCCQCWGDHMSSSSVSAHGVTCNYADIT